MPYQTADQLDAGLAVELHRKTKHGYVLFVNQVLGDVVELEQRGFTRDGCQTTDTTRLQSVMGSEHRAVAAVGGHCQRFSHCSNRCRRVGPMR